MQRVHWLGLACISLCLLSRATGRGLAEDSSINGAHARGLKQTDSYSSSSASSSYYASGTPSPSDSSTYTPTPTSSYTSTPSATPGPTPTSTPSYTSSSSAPSASASSPPSPSQSAPPPSGSTSTRGAPSTAPTPSGSTAATPSGSAAVTPTGSAAAPTSTSTSTGYNQYTNAGSNTTLAYAASGSGTTSVSATASGSSAATATTAGAAQSTVESGLGGPDYAGAYEHSFTAVDVTATPSSGSTGSPVSTTTASGSTLTASAASLNPSVVYAQTANATTRSFQSGSGSYTEAGLSGSIAIHAIYSTDETVLFFERPHVNPANPAVVPNPYLTLGNGLTEIASVYDIATQTFTPFHFSTNAFCAGHVAAPDGSVVIAGGDNLNLVPGFLENGLFDVRHFEFPGSVSTPAEMGSARWYPTTITLPDGTTLIAGGSTAEGGGYTGLGEGQGTSSLNNPTYQIFDASSGSISSAATLPILTRTWPVNLYPYLAVLPVTASILVIAGAETEIYSTTNTALGGVDPLYPSIPDLPVPVSYPQTATFALLSLEPSLQYTPEVVVFGGTSTDQATSSTPSSSASYRINLGSTAPGWEQENMPFPRVMGDAVHLPDGTIFICNGGQVGIAGGVPLAAAASNGITTAVLYNPYLASGSRYSVLADSQIQRLYHSNAFLLSSGEVLIAGSEATLDYRVQIYTPAYLQTGTPRPTISATPTTLTYGAPFTFTFGGVNTITRVTLIRQSAVTHSIHMDARQVALVFTVSGSTVSATSPPDASIAIPGNYLLFALDNGIPSVGTWVNLA